MVNSGVKNECSETNPMRALFVGISGPGRAGESKCIDPLEGLTMPASMLRSVVFPAPLLPNRATSSPF